VITATEILRTAIEAQYEVSSQNPPLAIQLICCARPSDSRFFTGAVTVLSPGGGGRDFERASAPSWSVQGLCCGAVVGAKLFDAACGARAGCNEEGTQHQTKEQMRAPEG
jgi:hypothetical protein